MHTHKCLSKCVAQNFKQKYRNIQTGNICAASEKKTPATAHGSASP